MPCGVASCVGEGEEGRGGNEMLLDGKGEILIRQLSVLSSVQVRLPYLLCYIPGPPGNVSLGHWSQTGKEKRPAITKRL